MEAYAAEHRVPSLIGRSRGFWRSLPAPSKRGRALECGMAIGYSVIHLARGMADDGLS